MKKTFLTNAPDGKEIFSYEIGTENLLVRVINFGAVCLDIIKHFDGEKTDIALGCSSIPEYFENSSCFGAIVGRNCNRIGGAKFTFDGKTYILENNDFGNNLHSGSDRFNLRVYDVKKYTDDSITFSLDSKDGDQGFPHALHMEVTYTVSGDALIIDYSAKADGRTIWNPTYHGYFNLDDSENILNHEFSIHSEKITYSNEHAIPDGTFREIAGTPFDFRSPMKFGEHIEDSYDELKFAGGYDHNFVLEHDDSLISKKYSLKETEESDELKVYEACRLSSGNRSVTVFTDLPGIQIYTGNYIENGTKGKNGKIYNRRKGVAMETQFFPNAVNIPSFEQPVIDDSRVFRHRTVYEIK